MGPGHFHTTNLGLRPRFQATHPPASSCASQPRDFELHATSATTRQPDNTIQTKYSDRGSNTQHYPDKTSQIIKTTTHRHEEHTWKYFLKRGSSLSGGPSVNISISSSGGTNRFGRGLVGSQSNTSGFKPSLCILIFTAGGGIPNFNICDNQMRAHKSFNTMRLPTDGCDAN